MSKCFSYIRFSSDKQEQGDSVRRQTELAEKWVAANPELGLELDTSTYRDLGVSGYRGLNSETGRLGDFKRAVEDGTVPKGSYLVVESLDRIGRQSARKALRVLEDIVDLDVSVVTLSDRKVYTKTSLDDDPTSLMIALLTFIRANEESKMKSDRGLANWNNKRKKAASGKVMTNNVVSWLDVVGEKDNRKLVINEDKSAIVKSIVEMFLSGKGCQAIATKLNIDGVMCLGKGKHWEPRTVHSILSNPALCGRYVMGDKAVASKEPPIDGYFPALISVETFNEISLMLNTGNVKQRDPIANPIAGICFCGVCGSKMTRFKTRSHGERLICSAAKVRKCQGGYKTIKLATVYDRLKLIVKHPQTFAESWPPGSNNRSEIVRLRFIQGDLETKISTIAEAIMLQGHSLALGARLKALETEKASVDAAIELEASRAVLGGQDAMNNRLVQAREAIEANDIVRVNGLLRRLFGAVVVNVKDGTVKAEWFGV